MCKKTYLDALGPEFIDFLQKTKAQTSLSICSLISASVLNPLQSVIFKLASINSASLCSDLNVSYAMLPCKLQWVGGEKYTENASKL